jgi:hypothetical protein
MRQGEYVCIVGPVCNDTTPIGDGCFFVAMVGGKECTGEESLLWFFPYIDSEPQDASVNWHVLAGFATKEEAEARRRQWLADAGCQAVNSRELFRAVAELCRLERYRTYRRAVRRAKRRALLRRGPLEQEPGVN